MNTGNDCMTYLVGNQVDNEDAREVTTEKATQYADEAGISKICETSAKTGERVEEIFINAAKMLYVKNKNKIKDQVMYPLLSINIHYLSFNRSQAVFCVDYYIRILGLKLFFPFNISYYSYLGS